MIQSISIPYQVSQHDTKYLRMIPAGFPQALEIMENLENH